MGQGCFSGGKTREETRKEISHLVEEKKWTEAMKLANSANLSLEIGLDDKHRWNMLFIAVRNREPQIVKRLLSRNVRSTIRDADDRLPWYYAGKNKDLKTLEILLEKSYLDVDDLQLPYNDLSKSLFSLKGLSTEAFFYFILQNIAILKFILSRMDPNLKDDYNGEDYVHLHFCLLELASQMPIMEDLKREIFGFLLQIALETIITIFESDPLNERENDNFFTSFKNIITRSLSVLQFYCSLQKSDCQEPEKEIIKFLTELNTFIDNRALRINAAELLTCFAKYFEKLRFKVCVDYLKFFEIEISSPVIQLIDCGFYKLIKRKYLTRGKVLQVMKICLMQGEYESSVDEREKYLFEGFMLQKQLPNRRNNETVDALVNDLYELYFTNRQNTPIFQKRVQEDVDGWFSFQFARLSFMKYNHEKANELVLLSIKKKVKFFGVYLKFLENVVSKDKKAALVYEDCLKLLFESILDLKSEKKKRIFLGKCKKMEEYIQEKGLYSYVFGKVFMNRSNYDTAVEYLIDATTKNEENVEYHQLLRLSYEKSGLDKKALKYLDL